MTKPIDNPDTSNTDPTYWERVLASYGLTANAGRPERRKTWCVGISYALTTVEEQQDRKDTGVVEPPGAKPK